MPRRNDIDRIMVIGSGPIIIGQGSEFDYSGTQACSILRREGYYIILINSNPATIMTDFEIANSTYIEPITPEIVARVIEIELPDALLPTLGGQTALNTVLELSRMGVLEKFGVDIIGANLESINKAESRKLFKKSMESIGLRVTKSDIANNISEAINIGEKIGFPLVTRASFTMGGAGSFVVDSADCLEEAVYTSLRVSPVSQVILEESLIGWKEYELELMRDCKDNVVVVCSIENIDPVGIHTGDSITVAPVQTLTDKEYQIMRDAAINIIREIGVDTGGANVQFAINPKTGEMVVIEMNPRVSRSSALASKATGFPIAKIAAKLAIGYFLDEINNDITGKTTACFEPSIDYCVVKIPVWDTEKFYGTKDVLTTTMKAVGETMAIGRTFKEAFQKAIRSSGTQIHGFGFSDKTDVYKKPSSNEELRDKLGTATSGRLSDIYYAFNLGINIVDIAEITGIDLWFILQFYQIFEAESSFTKLLLFDNKADIGMCQKLKKKHKEDIIKMKEMGFSDIQIAKFIGMDEVSVALYRQKMNIKPVYKSVDTCSAEFSANSPYFYSTYEIKCEVKSLLRKVKVVVLGSGPNRIGQGIEFDYCCVHASLALRESGVASIMINSNPETVSTDYDISDRLYFEPLTYEDVMNVICKEKPYGVIVQFGGQIPLNLSELLDKAGVRILGTQPTNIKRAEDRGLFQTMLAQLELEHPRSVSVTSVDQGIDAAELIGYPVMVRPSFVLGGKAVNIAYDSKSLTNFIHRAISVSSESPILIDEFLQDAMEIDVDAISDKSTTMICGIMEHIEEAGIHSGDSAYILPTRNIPKEMINRIVSVTNTIAAELNIIGLMNIQYAIRNKRLYVIEVNPRASRTIPFVSKATGIPFAKIATKIMLGKSLVELGIKENITSDYVAVKEAVFSFDRFIGSDISLSPEMKSTGEVMGIGPSFASAYAKAQLGAGQYLPLSGTVFLGSCDRKKDTVVHLIDKFEKLGFGMIVGNYGWGQEILSIKPEIKLKKSSSVIDMIEGGEVQIVVTISNVGVSCEFGGKVCRAALKSGVPYVTTFYGALATCDSIEFLLRRKKIQVRSLQQYIERPTYRDN